MYELGKLMRLEYSNFIPRTYWPKDVNVTSSYSERCLMSAELFSAGLFPPEGSQIWNNDLLWQPLPIYYAPRDQDTVSLFIKYFNSIVRPCNEDGQKED